MPKPTLCNDGLEPIAAATVYEIGEAVMDLAAQNWPKIDQIIAASPRMKLAIAFSVKIDRSGKQTKIRTSIAFSDKSTDEREVFISDPRQGTLAGIDGKEKE